MRKQVKQNPSQYVRIFNTIAHIDSQCVVFINNATFELYNGKTYKTETQLRRTCKVTGLVIWDLLPDGLFVHKEYAKVYKLATSPVALVNIH